MFPLIDKEKTGKKIKELMLINGYTPKDMQTYLNLSCVQSVYHWFDGSSIPTIDNLYALSELFHVTIDEMIRGNSTFSPYSYNERARILKIYQEKLAQLQVA